VFNDNWGLFGRFFKKGNIHKQRYTHKKQVQKSNVIGNSSKLIHLLFLIFSLKALAIISDIIPHINLTIKERAVTTFRGDSWGSMNTRANHPAAILTKSSEIISNHNFIISVYGLNYALSTNLGRLT